MLSNHIIIGIFPIKPGKESVMKQLSFEFIKEINKEVGIELSSEIKNKLIEQMAVVIIRVNKGGKSKNDDLANKQ
jgi:hypothetical protein